MTIDQLANDGNQGESEGVPEALRQLQADRRGRNDNRRWRYAVRDVDALSYAGAGIWRQVGPAPLLVGNQQIFQGVGPDSGEVVDIAVDPRGGPDKIIYLAAGSGGVWKSRDDGLGWRPITDQLPATSVGAIALDPADPDTVYIGTGNLFEGAGGMPKSAGLFKSTDGGQTWARLASPAGRPPQPVTVAVNDGGAVRVRVAGHGYSTSDRVAVVGLHLPAAVGPAGVGDADRIDDDTLRIVGVTMIGPYGGAGATLFDARQPPFLSDRGVIRMVCPAPGMLLVASEAGLYYSADGGRNFGANHPAFDDGKPVRTGVISALEIDQGWTRTARVAGATPASPIVVTVPRHGFATGDHVFLGGVETNRAANGGWLVDAVDDDHFALRDSDGNGTGADRGFVVGPAHPATRPVQGATNPAAPNPIVITSPAHGFVTGDIVAICGVRGNTNANRSWVIRVLSPDTFALVGSRGNAVYVAGTGTIDGPQHPPPGAITAAVPDAHGGVLLTVPGHGFVSGDRVSVLGLPGIQAPNNTDAVTVASPDTVRLPGLTLHGGYNGVGATVTGPADSWNSAYFVSAGRVFSRTSNAVNPAGGLFRLTITSTGELVLSDNLLAHQGGPGHFGRVAFCQSLLPRTRTLYACVQDLNVGRFFVGLFRSDDFGGTWHIEGGLASRTHLDTTANGLLNILDQTTYDLTVGVDPQDSRIVYAAQQQLWRSIDSGHTWPQVPPQTRGGMDSLGSRGQSPSTTLIHWDHHELVFPPATRWEWTAGPQTVRPTPVYLGTDGGITRSATVGAVDGIGGTMTFTHLNEGIATSLLRSIDIGRGAGSNAVTFGGMQDTGTAGHRRADAGGTWTEGIDGDGGDVAVDPFDPDIVFGFDNGRLIRSTNGGRNFFDSGFTSRIPIVSVSVVAGVVHVTTDGHTFRTGDTVSVSNVPGGGAVINKAHTITVLNPREFTLNGVNGALVPPLGVLPQVTGDRYLTSVAITAATLEAPIQIETAAAHGCATGQRVRIDALGGNLAANNADARPTWTVTVISPTRLSLDGSDGSLSPPYVPGTGRLRGPQVPGTVPVFQALGTNPVVITAQGHGFLSGDRVTVTGVTLNAAANSPDNPIRVLDANSFELLGRVGNHDSGPVPRVIGQSVGRGPLLNVPNSRRQKVALVPVAGAVSSTVYVSINNVLFRSTDGGISFTQRATFSDQISALHAPAADRLWVGLAGDPTQPRSGTVRFSRDGGATFLGPGQHFVRDVSARGAISAIREDPAVAAGTRVAVVVSGYSETATERRTRHVFLTEVGGISADPAAAWHELGGVFNAPLGNLPDIPIMGVGWQQVAGAASRLWVAADIGVLRFGDASVWERVGPNLPHVSCQALAVDNSVDPRVIRVGTYGRSAWEFAVPPGPSLFVEADLGFGEQQVGTTTRRRLVLHSVGTGTVSVSDISGATSDITIAAVPPGPLGFPIVLPSGQRRQLEVLFTPSAPGDRGAFLIVSSDDADQPVVQVRASGFGVAAGRPRLSVRAFLEFGTVQQGMPATLPLELRNLGNVPLTIDHIDRIGSPQFSLPGPPALPLTIAPGDGQTITVRLDVIANGSLRGALVVRGGGEGAVVRLSGDGTTNAAGMVAVLLNALGLSDPPEAMV